MVRYLTIVTLALASLPSTVLAQSGTPAEQRACRSDVARYCRGSIQGGGLAVANCLSAHRGRLHRACRAVLASHGF
jgi:hypothetical protein